MRELRIIGTVRARRPQGLDDPVRFFPAAGRVGDQLVQLAEQGIQRGYLRFYVLPVGFDDGDDIPIMKGAAIILDRQQLFNVGKRHAVVAAMADEAQALQIVLIVDPVVCRRAFCVGQQTDLFIVADGDCRAAGNLNAPALAATENAKKPSILPITT